MESHVVVVKITQFHDVMPRHRNDKPQVTSPLLAEGKGTTFKLGVEEILPMW